MAAAVSSRTARREWRRGVVMSVSGHVPLDALPHVTLLLRRSGDLGPCGRQVVVGPRVVVEAERQRVGLLLLVDVPLDPDERVLPAGGSAVVGRRREAVVVPTVVIDPQG